MQASTCHDRQPTCSVIAKAKEHTKTNDIGRSTVHSICAMLINGQQICVRFDCLGTTPITSHCKYCYPCWPTRTCLLYYMKALSYIRLCQQVYCCFLLVADDFSSAIVATAVHLFVGRVHPHVPIRSLDALGNVKNVSGLSSDP